jgi:hypothetical protein
VAASPVMATACCPGERIFRMALIGMRFGPVVESFRSIQICWTVDLFTQVRIFRFLPAWVLLFHTAVAVSRQMFRDPDADRPGCGRRPLQHEEVWGVRGADP